MTNPGDPLAAEQLLPLVHDELRKLAAARLAHEMPGLTLQATALVHEAYLRLVGDALSELERHDALAAQFVKLRYFAGFGHEEAAHALGIGRREADRLWALARAWLYQQLGDAND